jgi:anti-anti-sigma factor
MTATPPLTIGLTRNFAVGIPYWTIMEHSARERARELGAGCIVHQSLTGPEQAAAIHSLIAQRVAAIVVAAIVPDDPAFVAALEQARAAGIPLVAADVPLAFPVDCLVQSDDRRGAAAAACHAVEQIGGRGTVVHLQGDLRSPVAQMRSRGVHEVVDTYPALTLIETAIDDWSGAQAQLFMEQLLCAQPEIRAVIAANDPMALGALAALRKADRLCEVVVTGIDGDAEALLALQAGTLAATVKRSPYAMGRTAIDAAVALAGGAAVQPVLLLDDMALVSRAEVTGAALETLSILPGVLDGLMLNSTLLDGERTTLRTIIDSLPDLIYVKDCAGRFEVANMALARLLGAAHPDELIGKTAAHVFPEAVAQRHQADEQRLIASGKPLVNQEELLHDPQGAQRWFVTTKVPICNHEGRVARIVGRGQDITERKQAEGERQQLQEALIRAQSAALQELSTPLLAISDSTLVMPLIGSIDTRRVSQILDALLTGVAEKRAATVILDITGVPIVDTQVAAALMQAAQAVKLLGASIVITGVRPEVAQTLVQLGVELHGLTTRATLQDAIAYALRR